MNARVLIYSQGVFNMDNVVIRRPKLEQIDTINEFFELVLKDTFKKNKIDDLTETLENEIKDKRHCLNQDLESDGEDRFFLIATIGEIIVGSIEYGPSNDLISKCTKGKLKNTLEIGTVFVHPDYQSQGIGNLMLSHIFNEMKNKNINEFCLDSGYKTAQKIWIHKFGKPEYHLKDYWGVGDDHMVWRMRISDVLK